MDNNQLIGCNNKLPWHLPADMKYFRNKTLNKSILMGRKTFESFGAKPLPYRNNIILTKNINYKHKDTKVFNDIDQALLSVEKEQELMVIGGTEIYKQLLPYTHRIYLTCIQGDAAFTGDTWFPKIDWSEWIETKCDSYVPDEKNLYHYQFKVFEKNF